MQTLKENIENRIHKVYESAKASGLVLSTFYELALSVLAWQALSDTEKSEGKQGEASVPEKYTYTAVMKPDHIPVLKGRVAAILNALDKQLPQWKGLLHLDSRLIEEVPDHIWILIATTWQNLGLAPATQYEQSSVSIAIDYLEVLMSAEQQGDPFLTPTALAGLMTDCLNDHTGESLYDPYPRSGNLLAAMATHAAGKPRHIYARMPGRLAWKLTAIRLLLQNNLSAHMHWYNNSDLATLSKNNDQKQFDLVITNPPFGGSVAGFAIPVATGNWNMLAQRSKRLDVAFLCHALSSLADNGQATILLPAIFLSGNGIFKEIMKQVIAQNILEAVIELPGGLFEHTNIATVLLHFDKARTQEKKRKVFLLDATRFIEKSGSRVLLQRERIYELLQQAKKNHSLHEHSDKLIVTTTDAIAEKGYRLQFIYYKEGKGRIEKQANAQQLKLECETLERQWKIAKARLDQIISVNTIPTA